MVAKPCLSVGPASGKDDRMSFLNWPLEQNQLRTPCSPAKKKYLKLLDQFCEAFPGAIYELF